MHDAEAHVALTNRQIGIVRSDVSCEGYGAVVVDNAVFLEGKIPAEGPIELQVHGTPLWFRNIFVREIIAEKK